MRSVREIVKKVGVIGSPVSLRSVARERKVDSLLALSASLDIEEVYRQKGGQFGFGPPVGGVSLTSDGSYVQNYELGFATKPLGAPPGFFETYEASVQVAAVKCFGTEDPSGEDEPYLVVSVISVNPNFKGEDELLTTKIIRAEGVRTGDTFGNGQTIGTEKVVAGEGLRIHLALFEHEHGEPEKVREEIEKILKEAVKKGAEALVKAVAGGDVPLGGTVGEITDNPLVIALTRGLSAAIAPLIADDQIGGEKVLSIKASKLVELAIDSSEPGSLDRFKRSLLTTTSDPDIEFNFPIDHLDRRWLFEGGDGSYKVYVKVTPRKVILPVP